MSAPPSSIMLFGKLPTQGDFVRVGMSRGNGPELEAWLGRAVEHAQGQVPQNPVYLLTRFAPGARLLVGAWVPSMDAVGRAFPFSIFRDIEEELSIAPLSSLPTFLAPWFTRTEALARTALGMQVSATASDAAAVDLGHPSEIPSVAHDFADVLTHMRVSELAQGLYPESTTPLDQLAYGLSALEKAVERGHTAREQRITVDAPCTSDLHVFVWLEVLRRTIASSPLGFMIALVPSAARMLISLGSPSDALLSFLITPNHPSPERWPLSTSRADAAVRARDALPRTAADVLVRDGAGWDLLVAFQKNGSHA